MISQNRKGRLIQIIRETRLKTVPAETQISTIVDLFYSQELEKMCEGVVKLRKIISVQRDPPIQTMIDLNLVPRLIELVIQDEFEDLKMESMWILSNVASGTSQHCDFLINKGLVPIFIKEINSPNPSIAQQALWFLGNVAGDTPRHRDILLSMGAMPALCTYVKKEQSHSQIKHAIWAISNLCRGTPLPKKTLVVESIPLLIDYLLIHSADNSHLDTLTDALWALTYIIGQKGQYGTYLFDKQAIGTYINLIDQGRSMSVIVPCIRTLSQLFLHPQGPKRMLKYRYVEVCVKLLQSHKKTLRRQAYYNLSNIATESDYVQQIYGNQLLMNLTSKALVDQPMQVAGEAIYVLTNLIQTLARSKSELLRAVVEQYQLISVIFQYLHLHSNSEKGVIEVLRVIEKLLSTGQSAEDSYYITEVSVQKRLGILETLQMHNSQSVYSKAAKILSTYFETEQLK